ncbi:MAG: glycogen synthase GlgA [Peptoclostridium sp.]|uniref:glycogen synthase GlgA n=1 Tax=Peptoclostridium sp. TaxID=1904860 RepID=UPI00139D1F62|nr:glycogen synthase GlgA [Peptoclostridium sp.]MZQ75404.1 glycogen synthase GlgA [Peptoclostridium sp.]
MTRVLFAASEAYPFIKTGGLADVAFALPRELRRYGVDARVIIPKYMDIKEEFKSKMKFIKSFNVHVGWRNQYCGILECEYEGVPFYFVDNEYYFKRHGIYGHHDEAERFAFFSRAVLEFIANTDFKPEVIHCNDWQTGMVCALNKLQYRWRQDFANIKTVFTIHNLKYQGIFAREMMSELFGLGYEHFNPDGLEYKGALSYMKGGLAYSNAITTVSETYAGEIQNPHFGEGLEGALQKRNEHLFGILNGIDYDIYNPKTDSDIIENYDAFTATEGKLKNKLHLLDELGLEKNADIPVMSMITRLTEQKGLDLVECVFDELLSRHRISIAVLGTGDRKYENLIRHYAAKYEGRVSASIKFDNALAQKIYAGSDMLLMPSRFEPCGLSQLIALRYGTLPIVRETGGLKDTVVPYNKYTGEGNGFSFANYNAHEMLYTIIRAVDTYMDKPVWDMLVRNAMRDDFSWNKSALMYKSLYKRLL